MLCSLQLAPGNPTRLAPISRVHARYTDMQQPVVAMWINRAVAVMQMGSEDAKDGHGGI